MDDRSTALRAPPLRAFAPQRVRTLRAEPQHRGSCSHSCARICSEDSLLGLRLRLRPVRVFRQLHALVGCVCVCVYVYVYVVLCCVACFDALPPNSVSCVWWISALPFVAFRALVS